MFKGVSPTFVISDEEDISSIKHKLSESDQVRPVLHSFQIVNKRRRLPDAFSLVSYESEEEDMQEYTPATDMSIEKPQPDVSSGTHTPIEDFEAESLPFVISDGSLTVLSSQHKMTDVQAISDFTQSLINSTALLNHTITVTPLSQRKELMAEVALPPEPPGPCDFGLQQKVDTVIQRMRADVTYDPNTQIQDNKNFRNPSMYEKLITFLKIDEKGTNFSPEMYNPHRWNKMSFYDELAKVQHQEIVKFERILKSKQKSDSSSQLNIPHFSSEQSLSKIFEQAVGKSTIPTASSEGSIATGFFELKKPSKWDTDKEGIPPHAVTDNDPEMAALRLNALSTKLKIPAVGSLMGKK